MPQPGRVKASNVKSDVEVDVALRTIRTEGPPANALVVGDGPGNENTIQMEGNDYLQLYVDADLDLGSTVTDIRMRITKGPGGADPRYTEVSLDLLAVAASPIDGINVMPAELTPLEYKMTVAAGGEYHYLIEIPINEDEVQVSTWADAAGHANDKFRVRSRRLMRDSLVISQ